MDTVNPNLDPQYKGHWGPSIIGILASLNALVIIITLLRVITRTWIVCSFWWDDLTIVLATVRTPFAIPPLFPSALLQSLGRASCRPRLSKTLTYDLAPV